MDFKMLDEKATQEHIAICSDYWEEIGETERYFKFKVSDIAATYSMKLAEVTRFVKSKSIAWRIGVGCPKCEKMHIFGTRSQCKEASWGMKIMCRECQEIEKEEKEKERARRKEELAANKREVMRRFKERNEKGPTPIENMSIVEKIKVVSFLLAFQRKNSDRIGPIDSFNKRTLTPGGWNDSDTTILMIKSGFIKISDETSANVISLYDDGHAGIALNSCIFDRIITDSEIDKINSDISRGIESGEIQASREFYSLCQSLQKEECAAYLDARLDLYGLYLSQGDEAESTIKLCLHHFTVSQACFFIWKAAKDAAAYSMRARASVSRERAGNSSITYMRNSIEKYIKEEWSPMTFNRVKQIPQSALNQAVDEILGTNDGVFCESLSDLLGVEREKA